MRVLSALFVVSVAVVAQSVGCADADNDGAYVVKRDGGADAEAPRDSTTTADAKDTGATDSKAGDSATPDTGPKDTGDPDTGDPDTGDPDTGTVVLDTGTIGGGTCLYCSSGTCPTPLVDYSCLLDCLVAGYFDCTYTYGASKPCLCHD